MIVGNQLYVPKPRQLIGYCYRFGFRSLDYGTAIAPGAFTQDVIDDYLKNPVLTSSVEDLPVGKVTHLAVDETGVWFTADVSDPGTVALMRRKVRGGFSIMGYVKDINERSEAADIDLLAIIV